MCIRDRSTATGFLNIEISHSVGTELVSAEERQHARGRVLGGVRKAVGPTVLSVEIAVRLEYEVCLSGEPPLRGLGVVEESCLWVGSGGLRVAGRPILRETGHDQRRESKSEHRQAPTETPWEPPGFHGMPKCSSWKMTDHATYFPHIVRDRAWPSSRARIPEVSHFFITAALPLSKRPGVLMICRSLGMSSDQLEKTPFRGHIKNHIAGMERGLTARRAASGIGVGLDAVTDGAAQHGIAGLERVEDRALRDPAFDFELHLATDVRQRP